MSHRPFPIFYEDSWGQAKEFGLHELVVACVADNLDRDWWELKSRFEAIPKRGVNNLLSACSDDVPDMPDPLIFAIFDSDKLHRALWRSGRPTEPELVAELRRRCPDGRLHMFLIPNTEAVVEAVANCLGETPPAKDPLARDLLLTRGARRSHQRRDCARAAVPSFDACVVQIAQLTAPFL